MEGLAGRDTSAYSLLSAEVRRRKSKSYSIIDMTAEARDTDCAGC
jgi:hypothetical protein